MAHEVSREELKGEVKFYIDLAQKYRAALRLCLADYAKLSWQEVQDRDVDCYVKAAENQEVEP